MSTSKLAVVSLVVLLVLPAMAFAQKPAKGAPPVISSIAPSSATAGGPAITLTVRGSNFVTGSIVLWNGNTLTTTYVSATELQAAIPSGLVAAAGTAQIAVYSPGRSGGTSNTVAFTINPAATTTTTTTAAPLAITTTSVQAGTVGTAYSASLAASGGTSPYTWSISGGALPAGLALSTAGAISGTPTASGTYSFTARVTDSASNIATQTYSMLVSTAPLAIATTSVPDGTAGTAYSAALSASGGNPPHSWSLTGGALPAGVSMSSSGAITGTPTASGTYSFVAQVADATSSTASRTYSLTVAAPTTTTPSADIVFRTGFEPGDPAWDYVWTPTDVTITSTPPPGRSGNALQIHYYICGDSTNTACGAAHQDQNHWVAKYFNSTNGYPNGLDRIYIRGYVYHKTPEPGGSVDLIQRKLYYIIDPNWNVVIMSDSSNGRMPLRVHTNLTGLGPHEYWNVYTMDYDQWYCVELEVILNTLGQSDGQITLWMNGSQAFRQTGLNLRGSYTVGISEVRIGEQADRNNYLPVDEYRYWDDVVISTSPIGP